MADSIFYHWEQELNKLKDDYNKAMEEITNLKRELYNLNYGAANKPRGRIIHDDHRLVLSAPEIIIGNVNLAGILNPDTNSTIIIRGNQVAVEGSGSTGTVTTRASKIEQKAENPGIDGTEHKIEALSCVITQGCSVTVDSSGVEAGGAFLDPPQAGRGCVSISSDAKINLSAQKSKTQLLNQLETKVNDLSSAVNNTKAQLSNGITDFKNKREEIEKLLGEREKIDKEEFALRTDYHDLDELNLQIDEKSLDIVNDFYESLLTGGNLIELERQRKYFTQLRTEVGGINDIDFKNQSTNTAITLTSESLQLTSADGDNNLRTNKDAGVTIAANAVKVEGAFDGDGSLEKSSIFSVNTRKVELSTAGKKGVQKDEDGTLNSAQFPAEGEVIINSKTINMQTVDTEVKNKKFQETGLTNYSKITIRSKQIDLSNLNSSDINVKDDGSIESVNYKPAGKVNIFSSDMTISSMETKFSNDKTEDTNLDAKSQIKIRSHKLMFDSTDHQGKLQGEAYINAKTIDLQTNDTDPKTGKTKEMAKGGCIQLSADKVVAFGKEQARLFGEKDVQLSGKKTLVQGSETSEIKQSDNNFLSLSGGNAELSGSKNTLKGETTIKVLKSPSITVDNLTANKAIKAPNLSDGIMVDTKDTSTSSSKLKDDEKKGEELSKNKTNLAAKAMELDKVSASDQLFLRAYLAAQDEGLKSTEQK